MKIISHYKGLKKDMSLPSLYLGALSWKPTGDIVPLGFVRLSLKGAIPSQAPDRLVYLLPSPSSHQDFLYCAPSLEPLVFYTQDSRILLC